MRAHALACARVRLEVPSGYGESPGVFVRQTYWAVQDAAGPYHLIKFLFYEAGTAAAARYTYMQDTVRTHCSVLLWVVSSVDRASLELLLVRPRRPARGLL